MNKTAPNAEGKYSHLIVQDLVLPETHTAPVAKELYSRFGRRIHWIDSSVVPGSFQMNTSLYLSPTKGKFDDRPPEQGKYVSFNVPHSHDNAEILGFYGTDPDNPYDLGGEIEIVIDGELHVLTKSSLVFLPGGLPHCPLAITKVDRPIFHFSIVMDPQYTLISDGKVEVID
jgi:hypothetical protein